MLGQGRAPALVSVLTMEMRILTRGLGYQKLHVDGGFRLRSVSPRPPSVEVKKTSKKTAICVAVAALHLMAATPSCSPSPMQRRTRKAAHTLLLQHPCLVARQPSPKWG
jgi:hypothetical protein